MFCYLGDTGMKRDRSLIFISGLIITAVMMGVFLVQPRLMTFLDHKVYDVMHAWVSNPEPAQCIIVDIDDAGLEQFGQWPWPRRILADLFSRISAAGPRAVGVDILLTEPDRTSLEQVLQSMTDHNDTRSALLSDRASLPAGLLDNDLTLARSLDQGPFILACKFVSYQRNAALPFVLPLYVSVYPPSENLQKLHGVFPIWQDILAPLPLFTRTAHRTGFVNALSDADGIIRRTPMVTAFRGRFYPSLSLAVLMQAMDTRKIRLDVEGDSLSFIRMGKVSIPVSRQGHLLLNFRDTESPIPLVSASEILTGGWDSSILHDQIVFVGTSASGLGDHHDTPLEQFYPGVGIHATAVDNILSRSMLSRPFWARGAEWLMILMIGLFTTIMLTLFGFGPCFIYLILTSGGLWATGMFFLQYVHLHISITASMVTLMTAFTLLSLLRFRMEEKRRLQRTREMVQAQNLTLIGITSLAATRDKETGMHIRRTAAFVRLLAEYLQQRPHLKSQLDDATIEAMYKSAPLHDIGKVGIPDAVLLKPGRLSSEEFSQIQKHTDLGWQAIDEAEKTSGIDGETSFLRISKEICRSHHEKWDGSGYNHRLKGEEIPLSARIMAVADVYDALTSKRVYKGSFDHGKTRNIIIEGRGSHFDPDVVDAFLALQERFRKIAIEMADG